MSLWLTFLGAGTSSDFLATTSPSNNFGVGSYLHREEKAWITRSTRFITIQKWSLWYKQRRLAVFSFSFISVFQINWQKAGEVLIWMDRLANNSNVFWPVLTLWNNSCLIATAPQDQMRHAGVVSALECRNTCHWYSDFVRRIARVWVLTHLL